MPRPRALLFLASLLVLSACGGGATQPAETTPDDTPSNGGDEGDAPPADGASARALGMTAAYGDLVSAAQRLDDTSQGDSSAGCLLRGAGPFRLEADVAVAIRPLPEAPADLDARVGAATKVRVFTRWGQLGADGQIAIAAFTTTPPPRAQNGVAFFLTDQGAYLRPIGDATIPASGPVPIAQAATTLADGEPLLGMIAVASEAGVPLATVRGFLGSLPADGTVALGVTLADDVRLPDPGARTDDGRGRCPDGLPALRGAEGELDAPAILGALGPLREAATRCLASAQGMAAIGGRISVAFRIGPDGRVTEACAQDDAIGDPALRACILDAARATAFPAPRGAGSVDAVLPLVLRPDASFAQRPLCE